MHRIACLVAAFAIAAIAPALADDVRVGSLEIAAPWIRATPPAARAAGGFLTIRNTGDTADRLTGLASPLGTVEIHTMDMTDGVMRMRHLPDGLEIPAGETVMLKPGGNHLMFVGLTRAVVQGSDVPVTLMFERAGEVAVMLEVAPIGARGPSGDGMAAGHGQHEGKAKH
ncbi:MAG: copper chaperone PCu(A)C [Sneathiellaceae bacterium]